uniref:Uncharacterized protein LOC111106220 n=1 Tax=Crassostrea virginica TaxID=6565 RepID=A0A8B8AZC3_CRAVI|nr:uncharacterized protein LOC111106220 [Crassostrea virginica]
MTLIGLCIIWLFLGFIEMGSISLEMNNTLTDCDNGYIEIRCDVDGELLSEIYGISLKRYDGDVATLSEDDVIKGKVLANRSGVTVNSLLSDGGLSYLSIRIVSPWVNVLKDKGPYQCLLFAIGRHIEDANEETKMEILNITDIDCSQPTTEIYFTNSTSTVDTQSNKNTKPEKNNIGMYREFSVVTGVVICCILLLIMVREIRIYYCTSEDIVYV